MKNENAKFKKVLAYSFALILALGLPNTLATRASATDRLNACISGTTKDCSNLDFSRADFGYHDYSGSDFSYSNLSNKDFRNVNFRNSNFTGANLSNSNVYCLSNFSNSNFTGADLSNFTASSCSNYESNFLREGPYFQNSNFSYANLTNAHFKGYYLQQLDLSNANFTGATMIGVTIVRSITTNLNLGANLEYQIGLPPQIIRDNTTPAVGETLFTQWNYGDSGLTGTGSAWPSGLITSFQWFRDGVAITNATQASYQLTSEDALHEIYVNQTIEIPRGDPSDYWSIPFTTYVNYSPVEVVQKFEHRPSVTQIESSDGVLHVSAQASDEDATLNYQWYKDDMPLLGQNGLSYTLQSGDFGRNFIFEVSQSKKGYRTDVNRTAIFIPSQVPMAPSIYKVLPLDANGNLRIVFDPGPYYGRLSFPTNYQWSIDGGLTWIGESDGVLPTYPSPNNSYLDAHIGQPNKMVSLVIRSMNSGGWSPSSEPFQTNTSISVGLSKPQISGNPRVGSQLQANVATSDPGNATLSYQWIRDELPIQGATNATYTVSASDNQHLLRVQVTGTMSNYSAATSLSDSVTIGLGDIAAINPPTVSGAQNPGSVLTAQSTNQGLRVSYLWLRDGIATEQTGETYKTGLDDVGSEVTVSATYSKDGFADARATSSSIKISTNVSNTPCSAQLDKSDWRNSSGARPTISGTGIFGSKLVGVNGSWASGTKFCTYWYENGQAIPGALSSTYTIKPSDIGQQIQYAVVGTDKTGKSMLRYSQPVTITNAIFQSPQLPKLGGNTLVGSKLTGAIVKPWSLGTTYSYQWQRNGAPIDGATSNAYQLTPQDLGSTITLQVCGTKEFFESLCLTNSFASQVGKGSIKPPSKVLIQGSVAKPGAVLTGDSGNWPQGVNISLQWLRDGNPITGATNATYTINAPDRGHSISFQVTGTSNGYTDAVKTSIAKKIP